MTCGKQVSIFLKGIAWIKGDTVTELKESTRIRINLVTASWPEKFSPGRFTPRRTGPALPFPSRFKVIFSNG
jgi:hypothetical protein